ncbi:MAG: hypothetical protein ACRCWF_15305 [Beijerinckiaceae bacterium]
MRFLGRLILIPLGIAIAAFLAGTFLVVAGFVQPQLGGALTEAAITTLRRLVESLMEDGEAAVRFGRLAQGLSTLTVALLFLPVAIVAAVSEVFSVRFWFVQALGAALLTALLPWAMLPSLMTGTPLASSLTGLLAVTGALAGSIYWMVAGRSAGSDPKTVEDRATVRAPAVRRQG